MSAEPERWARTAYRVALARSESIDRPDQFAAVLGLLERAGRILGPARSPLEHSRILTAAANCHRAAGRADQALELFQKATELTEKSAEPAERAASLINTGLTYVELGHPERAVEVLDQAIDLLGLPTSAERARLLGAAHLNRAQAHSFESPDRAVNDYEAALKVLEPGSPQAGMAAHGLGAALLEADQRNAAPERIDRAIEAFGRSLAILTPRSQPLRHGMARHSIALAYERRDQPGDLARALHDLEAAMTLFDPRLHKQHWERAAVALARVERELDQRDGRLGRMGHLMNLLSVASEQERRTLIRDRLVRVASFAAVRLRAEIDAMTSEMCRLNTSGYRSLLADFLTVLMELPDVVLRSACASLVLAHSRVPDGQERDVLLDESIHTTLFGPQRVKVRDLLRCNGWNRP